MATHEWGTGNRCTRCGDRKWMESECAGQTKYCNYPACNCAFDMGADNKCLVGYPAKGAKT